MVETEIEGEKERRAERREGGWRGHCRSGGKGPVGLLSSLLVSGGEVLEEHPSG